MTRCRAAPQTSSCSPSPAQQIVQPALAPGMVLVGVESSVGTEAVSTHTTPTEALALIERAARPVTLRFASWRRCFVYLEMLPRSAVQQQAGGATPAPRPPVPLPRTRAWRQRSAM